MAEVPLRAETGRPSGSAASRRLRRAGKVPAVLYGHGVESTALAVDSRELRNALTSEAGLNALLSLQVNGSSHLAMARQLQRHPVRGGLEHVDFVIVRRDEVVSAEVVIEMVGEAEAVHREGGFLDQSMFNLVIAALPGNIPPKIEIDVSALDIGDAIRVSDIRLPEGVTTEVDPEAPVVIAQAAQVVDLGEAAAEEAAEGEEGEAGEGAEGEGAEGGEAAASEGDAPAAEAGSSED
jgi:large subunit ribosomal protein L25